MSSSDFHFSDCFLWIILRSLKRWKWMMTHSQAKKLKKCLKRVWGRDVLFISPPDTQLINHEAQLADDHRDHQHDMNTTRGRNNSKQQVESTCTSRRRSFLFCLFFSYLRYNPKQLKAEKKKKVHHTSFNLRQRHQMSCYVRRRLKIFCLLSQNKQTNSYETEIGEVWYLFMIPN